MLQVVLRAQGKADALEALQSELYFVRRNGLATVLPATSDANSVYRDHVISMVDSLETLQLTVLLLIVVPFFASLFVGYGPTVRRVEGASCCLPVGCRRCCLWDTAAAAARGVSPLLPEETPAPLLRALLTPSSSQPPLSQRASCASSASSSTSRRPVWARLCGSGSRTG